MYIGTRNKVGYLIGEAKKPPHEDLSYAIWVTENHKVKSWLIDSMDPLLMQRFIHLSTAKEIWEAIAKTFYDGSNETCLFELNQKSFSTTKNDRSLSTYSNKLVAIF
uniref:Retrotransposon Copia-like N-terminal domain-containing protein n=1 Tax=Manihot esculenta TaxID=3983 RepID=A0A2C9UAP0_MANES